MTFRTRSGRELDDADIEALADEAERGYDVEHLKTQTAQFVATVTDEPIPGVPSIRVYGAFESPADALAALEHLRGIPHLSLGYLMLRDPKQLMEER